MVTSKNFQASGKGAVAYAVAELVCVMAGKPFAKITGSRVAIDGGSDRII